MKSEELASAFLEITSTSDVQTANKFIEISGGDINSAVALWLESTNNKINVTKNASNNSCTSETERPPDRIYSNVLIEGNQRVFHPLAEKMGETFGSNEAKADEALSKLYKLPKEINCDASFEEALKLARNSSRLLLVNIQNSSHFACHVLNRDVWRNEDVQEALAVGYVFWQRESDDEGPGYLFTQLYKVVSFPYLGAIHPRTGKELKSWDPQFFKEPSIAISQLFEFSESFASASTANETPQKIPVAASDCPSSTSTPAIVREREGSVCFEESATKIEGDTSSEPLTSGEAFPEISRRLSELNRLREERRKRSKTDK